jgi:hypothetical protein
VLAQLRHHVIKERDAGFDVDLTGAIEIEINDD